MQLDDLEPVVEVLPEGAACDAVGEVAVGRGDDAHVDRRLLFSPTRRISRSWSARRSLTCMPGETSPTSSSSSVPLFAASNSPGRSCVAPVNAPRACPKSSLSRSVSVMAPQLTAMNGPAARVDSSWTSRAIRSLPDPLSPVMRTVESTLATRRARSTTLPHRVSSWRRCPAAPRRRGATRTSARRCSRSFRSAAFKRLRDALERDVEALLEAVRLEEAQLLGALVAPLLARAPEEVAGRVALAHAAILEDVDLLARSSG